MKDKIMRYLDYPNDNDLDVEMRLIVDGGCHPDCQHMPYCVRYGLLCKAAYDKLKLSRWVRK